MDLYINKRNGSHMNTLKKDKINDSFKTIYLFFGKFLALKKSLYWKII
jgi:hypothetical protein